MIFLLLAGVGILYLGMTGRFSNFSGLLPGNSPEQPVAKYMATPLPTPPTITSFSAIPAAINAGQSTELQWSTTGATSVNIDNSIGPVALSGTSTVSPEASVTYVLTASNSAGSVRASVPVTVAAPSPPTVGAFTASPATINYGDSTTLSWNVSSANSVSIDQGVGAVSPAGTSVVKPTAATTYTLTATNGTGPATAKTTVTVAPGKAPVIANFAASPTAIAKGGSTTLKWNVTGASSVSLDHGFGTIDSTGSLQVSPDQTTTYTLTAVNAGNPVSATTTITVSTATAPIITLFTATPGTITAGQSTTLKWNVAGGKDVSINQNIGAVDPSGGTLSVTPASHTSYTLTAANDTGSQRPQPWFQ